MAIAKVTAKIRCDGCASSFEISLDPAQPMKGGAYDTIDDYVDWMIRGGEDFLSFSVQGTHQLCERCTRVVDDAFPEDPPGGLTYDQVSGALNKAAGV